MRDTNGLEVKTTNLPSASADRASPGRWIPLWLGLAVTFVPALVACGGHKGRPVDVSLKRLATQEDSYRGKLVRTQGVVRMFEPPRHYWIEDNVPNRVALEPEDLAAPLLGQEVRVVGRFHFDDRKGRVIEVAQIAPSAPSPASDRGGR